MKTLLALLLLASPVASQTVNVHLTDGTHQWYQSLPVPHKTADRAYWATTILSSSLTILDVENSIYALKSHPGSVEANGIFGPHPTRLTYYSISLPIFIANAYMSYRYKREDDALKASGLPEHRFIKWEIPNYLNSSFHVLGSAVTLLSTHK